MLLIEDQDRSKWDRRLIERAEQFLDQSAEGTTVSPYHLEAGIALHHCRAKSFSDTNWLAILRLYNALVRMHPSPIYLLNRAIVVAEIEGPRAGIEALQHVAIDGSMDRYHLFDATLGELYRRAGELAEARRHFEAAKSKTVSPSDRELIDRRLAMC